MDRFCLPAVACLLGDLLPPLPCELKTAFEAGAAIAGHVLDVRTGRKSQSPGAARAVSGAVTEDPGEASRLDAHEYGLAVKEDLVDAQGEDQAAASLVENRKEFTGSAGGLVDPTAQGGATGQAADRPEDSEQGEGLSEAQTHGGSGSGELLLLVPGAVDGLLQQVPQLAVLILQRGKLNEQLLARRPRKARIKDSNLDLGGMVVDSLARATRQASLSGNIAVRA